VNGVEAPQPDSRTLSGELVIIGQLHQSYILCEAEDGLILIDQHAAHERVHFEALSKEAALGSLASQGLMVPETLEVTAEEAAWVENSQQLFMRLGFRLDFFGSLTFVVRAVPAMTLRQDPIALLRDLVANGCSGESYPAAETVLERSLQSLACQLAIKAGQRLATEEMVALVQQLEGLDQYSTCPHGRPLWWKLTMAEVERIFGRS
jgi:DNA mismatch repair protein MutL